MALTPRRVAPIAPLLLVLALASGAPAAEGPTAQGSAARKLGRGLAAITCGFLELPGNVVQMTRERGPAWGFTLGFVEGLSRIPVRELVGVWEFLTAPIEAPADFAPIIEPEFPWDYFDS